MAGSRPAHLPARHNTPVVKTASEAVAALAHFARPCGRGGKMVQRSDGSAVSSMGTGVDGRLDETLRPSQDGLA
jgi:hypothetical protein